MAIAKTNSAGKWQMVGMLTFLDPPRPDTKQVSRELVLLVLGPVLA